MTFSQFSELPAELRFKIFKCCSTEHLLNVALASKQCREDVLPYISASLHLSWHRLGTIKDVEKFEFHLKHTKQLKISGKGSLGRPQLDQGYMSFPFHNILRYCNPDKLWALAFHSFMVAGGLQVASELLPAIRYLNLDHIAFVRNLWDGTCSFRYLKVLAISNCDIVDSAFKNIDNLTTLRKLFVTDCRNLTSSSLLYFNKIASFLTTFQFADHNGILGDRYEYLSNLKDIKSLYLYETNVEDSLFMQWSGKLKSLTDLDINATYVTDLMMPAISSFVSLKELNVSDCNITGTGLEHIVKLRNLKRLNLSSCNLKDFGLVPMSKMRKLASLDLNWNSEITDQGLVHVMNLPSLTSLEIMGCNCLTNTSLEMISKRLLRLELINASCEKFTIDGLNHLLALPHLKDVYYDEEEISYEDFDTFCASLSSKIES